MVQRTARISDQYSVGGQTTALSTSECDECSQTGISRGAAAERICSSPWWSPSHNWLDHADLWGLSCMRARSEESWEFEPTGWDQVVTNAVVLLQVLGLLSAWKNILQLEDRSSAKENMTAAAGHAPLHVYMRHHWRMMLDYRTINLWNPLVAPPGEKSPLSPIILGREPFSQNLK